MRSIQALCIGLALGAAAAQPSVSQDALPAVGQAAPTFTASDERGETVKLEDYKGKYVVLYFYPKDFTSGCTIEARNFQRDLPKYEDAGAAILGVSFDTSESHQDFCAKEGLSFKLLADTDGAISTAYGSVKDYNGNQLSARNTFIIGPDGKVAKVFTSVKPPQHSDEVLAALGELKKPAG
jgi:peroxiredoxin Q/BCP